VPLDSMTRKWEVGERKKMGGAEKDLENNNTQEGGDEVGVKPKKNTTGKPLHAAERRHCLKKKVGPGEMVNRTIKGKWTT